MTEITKAQATKLDSRIRRTAEQAETKMAELAHLVVEARTTGMHKLLGFATFGKYVADVIATSMPHMHRVAAIAVTKILWDEGLSTREIATATGRSQTQIRRDLAAAKGQKRSSQSTSLPDRVAKVLGKVRAQASTLNIQDRATIMTELTLTADALKARAKRGKKVA